MPWTNTIHNRMPHTATHTMPIGRITLTSPGNLIPLPMCPLVQNNSLVPHLNHSPGMPTPGANSLVPNNTSLVEQAILNLSKVVSNFVEEKKGINVQLAQRIDNVESTLNKRIDGLESNLNQKIDNLQYSITKINNLLEVQERGRFPSQTLPNPKGVHEIGSSINPGMDEVKAIITLRIGKEIEQPVPTTAEETCKEKEAEPERVIISEEPVKKNMPPPFPQELRGKKIIPNQAEIWEVLRQVKVNIPLLDMIKQVPTYAKFLKDPCTVKKGLGI